MEPNSIAVDSSGNVFIADNRNRNIEKLDGNGKLVTKWSPENSTIYLYSLVVDSYGNVFYPGLKGKILKFDNNGNIIDKFSFIGGTKYGQFGYGSGRIHSLALDSSSYIYVVDTFNNQIGLFASESRIQKIATAQISEAKETGTPQSKTKDETYSNDNLLNKLFGFVINTAFGFVVTIIGLIASLIGIYEFYIKRRNK